MHRIPDKPVTRRVQKPIPPPIWATAGFALGVVVLFGLVVVAAIAPLAPEFGLLEIGGVKLQVRADEAQLRSLGFMIFVMMIATMFAASAQHSSVLEQRERNLGRRGTPQTGEQGGEVVG